MKLYLSSYRLGNSVEELKNWLINHDKNIAVIPNAIDEFPDGERKTNRVLEKCKDLEDIGFIVNIINLRKYFNNPEQLSEKLNKYKSFYVIGGNVFVLRTAMKLSGFDNYIRNIANEDDCLYAGFSAGICVLANDLHGIHLADNLEADPYQYGKLIWDGIGLIDYMPVPHYDSPTNKESPLMYNVVSYLDEHNLPYKVMRDGDVFIEDLKTKGTNLKV